MRHLKDGRRLGRFTAHREAMLKNMAASLVEHGGIETTLAKAKELRRLADKLITLGKKGTLHSRREAYKVLRSRKLVGKLFDELASRFSDRNGGYTRIYKLGFRRGDNAPMARIEYIEAVKKSAKSSDSNKKTKGAR